jgi:hypothetical protein
MVVISEQQRLEMHRGLVAALGEEVANVLMEHLPPSGWSEVATRSDMDHLGTTLRLEMRSMGSRLETKIATLGGDLHAEVASLGGELHAEIATLGGDLRREMSSLGRDLRVSTRTMVISMVTLAVAAFTASAGLGH